MSVSVLYMAMSLDGYIAGPNDEPDNPGGDGFMRLHEWFLGPDGEFARPSGPAGETLARLPTELLPKGGYRPLGQAKDPAAPTLRFDHFRPLLERLASSRR